MVVLLAGCATAFSASVTGRLVARLTITGTGRLIRALRATPRAAARHREQHREYHPHPHPDYPVVAPRGEMPVRVLAPATGT